MKKQTVEQRYHTQLMMNSNPMPKNIAKETIATPVQKNYQKLLSSVNQALLEASQAVQQVQAINPSQPHLATASNRLAYAKQQIHQLEMEGIQPGFTKGTEQQLMQLHNQIETAAGTLAMIQQAME